MIKLSQVLRRLLPLLFIFPAILAYAQEYEEGAEVLVIIHKIVIPDGGTLQEALALSQEWTEHVLRKNENFTDIQLLLSDPSKDTIDLLVLYTYRENISRNTNDINQELIEAHWGDESNFNRFLDRLHQYILPENNVRRVFRELILE